MNHLADDIYDQSDFPFLHLPPEIRNQIYRETLHEDLVVQLLIEPQPGLLRTNKQIRNEALPIYYGENQFFVSIHAPSGLIRIPSAVRFFVNDVATSIKAHMRHIIIHIHDRFDDRTKHYDHILEFTDGSHGPILATYRVGEPSADWTDYLSARKDFYSALDEAFVVLRVLQDSHDVYSKQNQPAYALFKAVWLLAQTFTAATKSVYTDSWRLKDCDLVYELLIINREGLGV